MQKGDGQGWKQGCEKNDMSKIIGLAQRKKKAEDKRRVNEKKDEGRTEQARREEKEAMRILCLDTALCVAMVQVQSDLHSSSLLSYS